MDFLDRLNQSLMENHLVVDGRVNNYLRLIKESIQVSAEQVENIVSKLLGSEDLPTIRRQRFWEALVSSPDPSHPQQPSPLQGFIKETLVDASGAKRVIDILSALLAYRKIMDSEMPPVTGRARTGSFKTLANSLRYLHQFGTKVLPEVPDGSFRTQLAKRLQSLYTEMLTDPNLLKGESKNIRAAAEELARTTGVQTNFPEQDSEEEDETQAEVLHASGPGPETPPTGIEPTAEKEPPATARRMAEIEQIAQQMPDEDDNPPDLKTRIGPRDPKKPLDSGLMDRLRRSAAEKTGAQVPKEAPPEAPVEVSQHTRTPGQKNVEILAQVGDKALVRVRGKSAIGNAGPRIKELAYQYNVTYRYTVVTSDEVGGQLTPDTIWQYLKSHADTIAKINRSLKQAQSYGDAHRESQLKVHRDKLISQFNRRFRTDVWQAYRELEQEQVGNSTFKDYFRQRYVGTGLQDGLLKAYLRWDPMDSYRLSGLIKSLPDPVIGHLLDMVRKRVKPDAEKVTRILAKAKLEQVDQMWDVGAAGGRRSMAVRPHRKYATEALILPLYPLTESVIGLFLEYLEEQPDGELIGLAITALIFNTAAKLIITQPEILNRPEYRAMGVKIPPHLVKFIASAGQRRQNWIKNVDTQQKRSDAQRQRA